MSDELDKDFLKGLEEISKEVPYNKPGSHLRKEFNVSASECAKFIISKQKETNNTERTNRTSPD